MLVRLPETVAESTALRIDSAQKADEVFT